MQFRVPKKTERNTVVISSANFYCMNIIEIVLISEFNLIGTFQLNIKLNVLDRQTTKLLKKKGVTKAKNVWSATD